jgi:phosphoglycerate-specific signal transduction histidine kinase
MYFTSRSKVRSAIMSMETVLTWQNTKKCQVQTALNTSTPQNTSAYTILVWLLRLVAVVSSILLLLCGATSGWYISFFTNC